MKPVDSLTFREELHMEGSFGAYSIGKHDCELNLWLDENRLQGFVEFTYGQDLVDMGHVDVAEVGLWFNAAGELIDYDGVMSFPPQAIGLLERNGFTVGEDFR